MEVPANLQIGAKVQVTTKEDVKLGTVAFVGLTSFAPGKWVGICLDDASGKNNGEVQGKRYFSCPENSGIFVRPNQIQVLGEVEGGDYIDPAPAEPATPKLAKPSGLKRPSGIATPGSAMKPPGSGMRMPSSTGAKGSSSSLSGSHSNLAAVGSKGSQSNLSSASSSKGSTGDLTALETKTKPRKSTSGLKPRITKGLTESPSTASISSIDEAIPLAAPAPVPSPAVVTQGTSLEDLEKIRGLEAEVKDLNEKLETIKAKRQEDRNRLKEIEKIKIQHEQLKEYKARSQETHKELQQQLLAAKKEAKDIQEQFNNYKDEMSELQETIELSALDKEMAEEKAESLQVELDSLKEKNDELTANVDLLKAELEGGTGPSAEGVTSYQVKQLEQQNEKLKEALVKMRDISNNDKSENSSLKKQNEKLSSEVSHLVKDKEMRVEEIEILNAEIIDLKDQLDAALGAEDMVEKLTDKNLALEERVTVLEEEKADLEAINEMNEELQENAREVELDMREQLDLSKSKNNQLEQSFKATQLQMADLQSTISKYRELVQQLQYENSSLRHESDSKASSQLAAVDPMEIKTRLTETKIQSKVIEMELLQLDVQYVKSQLNLTSKFLPESFYQHGRDGDGIQVALLFPNLQQRLNLLSNQLKAKFPYIPSLSKEDVVKSHSSEQSSYGAYLQCYVSQLRLQFHKLSSVLQDGDLDTYNAFAELLTEFKANSKPITQYLDLLQSDQLYEGVSVDPLAKSLNYFKGYCDKQLEDYPFDSLTLLRGQSRVLVNAAEALALDLKRLEIIAEAGDNDVTKNINKMSQKVSELLQTAKRFKHCVPEDKSRTSIQLTKEMEGRLKASLKDVVSAVHIIHSAATQADKALHLQPETDFLPSHQINQYLITASESLEDDTSDLYEALLACVSNPLERFKAFVAQLESGSLDTPATKKEKNESIIDQRAAVFRREVSDSEGVKAKLVVKEELITELKQELRKKQEEADEYKVRAGMADKKIMSASREKDDQILKLQRKIEESQVQLTKKEKEFEQTMDVLQADIDSLENEKSALQTKLNNMAKKQMYDNLAKASSSPIGASVASGMAMASGFDSPHLVEQISSLKSTVGWLREENRLHRAKEMKNKLANLKPLTTGLGDNRTTQGIAKKQQAVNIKVSLARLEKSTCQLMGRRQVSSTKVSSLSVLGSEEFKTRSEMLSLSDQLDKLKEQTRSFLASTLPTAGVQARLQSFPKPQSQSVGSPGKYIGRITVPTKDRSEVIRLCVTNDQLKSLLHHIA